VDISERLPQLKQRTLVLHSRSDEVVPVDEGRMLAGGLSGAEFVELDSHNHVLLEVEPAWRRFQEAVLQFVPTKRTTGSLAFAALSAREREVLALMTDGSSNARIADQLQISEKTARNHASNLFDKLGVRSRAEAIVFARDHGFPRQVE
jgi:DNA-binding NarL/FixJ family response regulator